jgi:prepilin-type N-terminal cleavage/methylation domain-containing protein/prepilin-type processing-associated H-X9-DG protein
LCQVGRRRFRRGFGGFTLTEVLVVVALIALLLGLLLPVLRAARERAVAVQCLSHLRSLGVAVRVFADQHEGFFPKVADSNQTPLHVRQELEPYVGMAKIFLCARDPARPRLPGGSYDWRFTDDRKASLAKARLDLIRHAGLVAIGGDRHPGWHKRDSINVLFADLHVAQVGEEEWFQGIKSPLR